MTQPSYEPDLSPLDGHTPEYLGHVAGRSSDAIKAYRAGRRVPPADVLGRLAAAIGVHPGALFRTVDAANVEHQKRM